MEGDGVDDVAVVVLSCDKFESLWPLFFERFYAHWPIANTVPLLVNNHKRYLGAHRDRVANAALGPEVSWADNLISSLRLINSKYVLLLIDDGPLRKDIARKDLSDWVKTAEMHDLTYIGLKGTPTPQGCHLAGSQFAFMSAAQSYRAALVPSIWHRERLLEFLRPGESAWHFEIFGALRTAADPNFVGSRTKLIECDHVVIKGKIDRRLIRPLKAEGYLESLDLPIMTWTEYIGCRVGEWRSALIKALVPDRVAQLLRLIKYRKLS